MGRARIFLTQAKQYFSLLFPFIEVNPLYQNFPPVTSGRNRFSPRLQKRYTQPDKGITMTYFNDTASITPAYYFADVTVFSRRMFTASCRYIRTVLYIRTVVLVFLFFGFFGISDVVMAEEANVIPKIGATAVHDGQMNEPAWQKALVLTGFKLPWNLDETPAATELRLFHNGNRLYFFYTVEEKSMLLTEPFTKEFDVASEDRIEIILEALAPLKQYYCCEMDYKGRVLDYCARFFRDFDFTWTFPKLEFSGCKTAKGYNVEGSYDLDTLRQLEILKPDNSFTAGFYRADFRKQPDGTVLELWYCRVKPKTANPEYHVPGMMQLFRLQ